MINDMITDSEKKKMKKVLLEKVQNEIKKNYHARYEKIYESVKFKEVMEEWTSIKQEY